MKRREFLGGIIAAGCLGAIETAEASPLVKAASKIGGGTKGKFNEDLVVFISDLHTNPGGYQPDLLRRTVKDILAMKPLPRNVIALGDLAYLTGREEEYALLKEIISPIEEAGITLTLAMGNHDRRDNFRAAFPKQAAKSRMKDRYVYVVETPKADIIVLDSLQQGDDDKTWITPGALNEEETAWLKETLETYKDKPVFVSSHHPIHELGIQKLLLECPCCRGYIHGHDHRWRRDWFKKSYSEKRIVPTLCLPSTGHWGDIGYTRFQIGEDKAVAYLHEYEFFFPKPEEDPAKRPAQWDMIAEDYQGAKCAFSFKD